MLSRIGKIARLPANIRYQLNPRLLDNESGTHLLTWLNGLPEVQVMLEQYFDSRPINQQNLSAWRTGGFSEWRFRREILITGIEMQYRHPANRNQTERGFAQGHTSIDPN